MNTNHSPKPVRRVVVALDSTSESLAILRTAAWLASAMDSQLAGFFVENRDLLRLANLPFAQEVSIMRAVARRLEPERLRLEIRARARLARQAVEEQAQRHSVLWTFDVVQDRTEAEVIASAQQDDLVAVAAWSSAAGTLRVSGAPTHLPDKEPGAAFLVSSRRVTMRPGPVTVVLESSANAEHLLRLAMQIAHRKRSPLKVIICAEDDETLKALRQIIDRLGIEEFSIAARSTFGGTGLRLHERLCSQDCGFVVMASDATGRDEKSLEDMLKWMRCPAVILRRTRVVEAGDQES